MRSSKPKRTSSRSEKQALPSLSLKIDKTSFRYAADCALIGIIFVMPLVMGGRHPLGHLIYVALVTLLTICSFCEATSDRNARWQKSRIEWILFLGLFAIVLQIIRLPRNILTAISPGQSDLLPSLSSEWAHSLGLTSWTQISLTPHATWLGLGMFVAHAMLFVVLVNRFQDLQQIKRILHWIALAALSMAVLGLLQYCSGTEKFSWVFEHYSRPANIDVTGPYVNSNHYAHFLALGIGPIVWWLLGFNQQISAGPTGNTFRGKKSDGTVFTWVSAAALALVTLAGLLAKSRGGMIVMFLAMLVVVGLFMRQKLLGSKAAWVLGGMALVVLAGLGVHGFDQVQDEVNSITNVATSGSLDSLDQSAARRKIWAANLEVARRFPILGTGVGSHEEVYQRFFPHFSLVKYTHAESSYIHLLTETGMAGIGLAALAILYLLNWLRVGLKSSDQEIATYTCVVAAGVSVSLVHSIFDFPWYIPSCIAIAIMLAAAACGLYLLERQDHETDTRRESRQTRGPAVPMFGWASILLLAIAVHSHVGPARAARDWIRYHKTSLNSKSLIHELTQAAGDREKTDKLNAKLFNTSRRLVSYLENVLRHDPYHTHANVRMAALCIELFNYAQIRSDNAMSLDMIRDAALSSQFPTIEAQDQWLANAIGPSRRLLDQAGYYATRSLQICPVQGRSYLQLGQVAFLKGVPSEGVSDLEEAALTARPYDGAVLFTVGARAALNGDVTTALKYYRKSFHLSHDHRSAIISMLAGNMPAAFFVNHFEPDPDNLELLLAFYRKVGQMDKAQVVGPVVVNNLANVAQSRSGIPAATVWHRARDICRYLGDVEKSLVCAQRAVTAAPNWYQGRIALAEEFMAAENLEAAYPEYVWCKRRRPHDKKVVERLATIEALYARHQRKQPAQTTTQVQPVSATGKATARFRARPTHSSR